MRCSPTLPRASASARWRAPRWTATAGRWRGCSPSLSRCWRRSRRPDGEPAVDLGELCAVEVPGRKPQLQDAHDVVVAGGGVVGLSLDQRLAGVEYVDRDTRADLVSRLGRLQCRLVGVQRLAQRLDVRDAADDAEIGIARLPLGGPRALHHALLGGDPAVLGLAHFGLGVAAAEQWHRELQRDLAVVVLAGDVGEVEAVEGLV